MSQVRNPRSSVINASSSGANTIVAALAGSAIAIWSIQFTTDAATNITFKSNTTALTGAFVFSASGSSDLRQSSDDPIYRTVIGEAFILSQSGTASIQGDVHWSYV